MHMHSDQVVASVELGNFDNAMHIQNNQYKLTLFQVFKLRERVYGFDVFIAI